MKNCISKEAYFEMYGLDNVRSILMSLVICSIFGAVFKPIYLGELDVFSAERVFYAIFCFLVAKYIRGNLNFLRVVTNIGLTLILWHYVELVIHETTQVD